MWTFEFSLMMFLIIIFISNAVAVISRGRISIQFVLGVICIMGFSFGWLQEDFVVLSKMKDVGFIAFNVLIIHSGTMINLKQLKSSAVAVKLSLMTLFVVVIVVGVGLSPIIGKPLAFMSPGPMLGGGATAAITSVSVLEINPRISVFPWLIFMVQAFIAMPVTAWALKKETAEMVRDVALTSKDPVLGQPDVKRVRLHEKLPPPFKTTAYYVGVLMIASVFNKWLNVTFLADVHLHMSVTGIFLGFLLGHFGIVERGPLKKSDAMGFLMLGLMSLLVLTLSNTPLEGIVRMLGPLALVSLVTFVTLLMVGLIGSKRLGISKYRGWLITYSCMVGFPMNIVLVKEAVSSIIDQNVKRKVEMELMKTLSVTAMLITNALSIIVSSLLIMLLH